MGSRVEAAELRMSDLEDRAQQWSTQKWNLWKQTSAQLSALSEEMMRPNSHTRPNLQSGTNKILYSYNRNLRIYKDVGRKVRLMKEKVVDMDRAGTIIDSADPLVAMDIATTINVALPLTATDRTLPVATIDSVPLVAIDSYFWWCTASC